MNYFRQAFFRRYPTVEAFVRDNAGAIRKTRNALDGVVVPDDPEVRENALDAIDLLDIILCITERNKANEDN